MSVFHSYVSVSSQYEISHDTARLTYTTSSSENQNPEHQNFAQATPIYEVMMSEFEPRSDRKSWLRQEDFQRIWFILSGSFIQKSFFEKRLLNELQIH